jgi:hypothetical protein
MNWKPIKEYENYMINEDGIIKNNKNKIIKPQYDKHAKQLKIKLCKDSKYKSFLLHRLLAINFIENTSEYLYVRHKDNDKTNNKLNNLYWSQYYQQY